MVTDAQTQTFNKEELSFAVLVFYTHKHVHTYMMPPSYMCAQVRRSAWLCVSLHYAARAAARDYGVNKTKDILSCI